MVQHRFVECVLVFEVVIKQRLVDLRRPRDRICPRPRNPMLGKFSDRRLQDRGSALLRLPASSQPGSGPPSARAARGTTGPNGTTNSRRRSHIINWLVRLSQHRRIVHCKLIVQPYWTQGRTASLVRPSKARSFRNRWRSSGTTKKE